LGKEFELYETDVEKLASEDVLELFNAIYKYYNKKILVSDEKTIV